MPLPPDIDQKICKRFESLVLEAREFAEIVQRTNEQNNAILNSISVDRYGRRGTQPKLETYDDSQFISIRTKAVSLLNLLSSAGTHITDLQKEIQQFPHADYITQLVGILEGLQDDYNEGILDDLSNLIEANVAADYLGQAEQLLTEGQTGQYDHVPAAVLTGAILEDGLRRLCQRQNPPIAIIKSNGDLKTLNPLIDDLKKAGVFNELKAKQLRAWADIRNAAAHGKFDEFTRQDVEGMLAGVQNFLADKL